MSRIVAVMSEFCSANSMGLHDSNVLTLLQPILAVQRGTLWSRKAIELDALPNYNGRFIVRFLTSAARPTPVAGKDVGSGTIQ